MISNLIGDINNKNITNQYNYFNDFKKQSVEDRILLSNKIKLKYSDRIPIIVDSKDDISITKNKFIVPDSLNVGQFMYILRNKIKVNKEQSLFLLCKDNQLLTNTNMINDIYSKYKDEDGFLYIYVTLENTFG